MSMFATQRRETRVSLLVGGLVALLILMAGGVIALAQKNLYTAQSVVVVLPNADLDAGTSASYYDALSQGQIVATFAELANNLRFEEQAETGLLLSEAQRGTTSMDVSVVPSTSVILIRASAEDGGIAEQMADKTAEVVTEYLGSLSEPYRTDIVHNAEGSAYVSGISPRLLFLLAVVAGPIAGLAVQQALYHLLVAVRWRSRPIPAAIDPSSTVTDANGAGSSFKKPENASVR